MPVQRAWLRNGQKGVGERCEWGAATCFQAAADGHLEILKWLRAEGCPWDAATCFAAVAHGHVEVLRWARENGCPWHVKTRDAAAGLLGYTDDFGNLVEYPDDDEYGYSDEYSYDE